EAAEVDGPRVGAGAGDDHFRLVLLRQARHLVEIDGLVVAADAVVADAIPLAGEVEVHAVRQVAAVRQVHGQDRVAYLQGGEIDGHVGAGAGVGLDFGGLGAEEAAAALDGQALGDVHELTAAVVATARVALGVLVGHLAALGGEHRRAGVV